MLVGWVLAACAGVPSPEDRSAAMRAMAKAADWRVQAVSGGDFSLLVSYPAGLTSAQTLAVYVEGDGFAWVTSSSPSLDPTPITPMGLKLAVQDARPAVYLGRPCQYVRTGGSRDCGRKYWTSHRFAPEVVSATHTALDRLKAHFKVQQFELVGYSGGAAVAALVAARRTDVARLVTVAGNLDHATWTRDLRLSPLSGSLNPADAWQSLARLPQVHFVGGQDRVIGKKVAPAYLRRFPAGSDVRLIQKAAFDHACCWAENWPDLLQEVSR
ncbi:hypothetical protein GCM10007924_03290 [Sneathiella chinensis]|uniref:Alpha/beta hydrolase n=1 Tax=Sneathiella chinensis TaxID=349750 RepID=A0ABQ5TZW2_9PROT|nr:hypothetical protein GCM10007924_03290 [Sneathiella chinensis]